MKEYTALTEFRKFSSKEPLVFLDYDGTLVPIIRDPENSYPDEELLHLLDKVRQKYEMYIVTGRSLREIHGFIGESYDVIALHGAIIWKDGQIASTADGYERYRRICDRVFRREKEFQSRYPGVHMINKDGGVVFTKWYLDPSLHNSLEKEIASIADEEKMECYYGKMIVELRIPGVNKGDAIRFVRNGRPALIAGDDATDEDAFKRNKDAISIKIGDGETNAKYVVSNYLEFRNILKQL